VPECTSTVVGVGAEAGPGAEAGAEESVRVWLGRSLGERVGRGGVGADAGATRGGATWSGQLVRYNERSIRMRNT